MCENSYSSARIINERNSKILIIDCTQCEIRPKNTFTNRKCFLCLLRTLKLYIKTNFALIKYKENHVKKIEISRLSLILEYLKKTRTIKKNITIFKNLNKKKCPYSFKECNLIKKRIKKFRNSKLLNPISLYLSIQFELSSKFSDWNDSISRLQCRECLNDFKRFALEFRARMEEFKIIKSFLRFKQNYPEQSSELEFYKHLLNKESILGETTNLKILDKKEKIESYETGPNGLFFVNIYKMDEQVEYFYDIQTFLKLSEKEEFYKEITVFCFEQFNIGPLEGIISLDQLIEKYRFEALRHMNPNLNLTTKEKTRLSYYVALKKLNLEKIFPLLIDDKIEEIFLDSPSDTVYINHQSFNRCRSNIKFTRTEIERFITMIRLYSGKRLDSNQPNIKHVIKNNFFYCRFAIDIPPLQINGPSLDIRKLDKNILTIQNLLKNDTLNPLMASFLYFNILRGKNITVTGATDSGKTTLINALDLLTPKEFRKIYVENIEESLDQLEYNKHQLKYQVDSISESIEANLLKSDQIKTLLHRTPDLIFLGEILTKEEAEAMFHCLAAGLKGFQTIHSNDISSLINRFLYHFNIPKSCLNDLDIIILMKKVESKRKIMEISEIAINRSTLKKLTSKCIFRYNPTSLEWDLETTLFSTNVVKALMKYENISEEKFKIIMKLYENIFSFFKNQPKMDAKEVVHVFHKISYYSTVSINSLEDFWINWKSRHLNQ